MAALVFIAVHRLSLVVATRGWSPASVRKVLIAWASHCGGFSLWQSTGSRVLGLQ